MRAERPEDVVHTHFGPGAAWVKLDFFLRGEPFHRARGANGFGGMGWQLTRALRYRAAICRSRPGWRARAPYPVANSSRCCRRRALRRPSSRGHKLGLFGRGEIPIANDVENCWNFVDDGTPLPLEIEPGGRIFELPSSRSRSSNSNDRNEARYSRLTCGRAGCVEHRRRDECDADRPRRVVLHQSFGPDREATSGDRHVVR